MYLIGHDNNAKKYFVYETTNDNPVIYKGTYTQCLVVIGALSINPDVTIVEIREQSDNFI